MLYLLQTLFTLPEVIKIKVLFVMDIKKLFPSSSSRKRDISDNSQHGENSKKLREGCSNSYTDNDDIAAGLELDELLGILVNCLKKLEAIVKEIFELANKLNDG